jgi:sugar phosphate isomerase/epimerase
VAKGKVKMIPVATQIWPVREEFLKDMPATLQAIARMGYDGVELCYYWPEVWDHAPRIRSLCDGLGLKIAGAHVPWEHTSGDKLKRVIAFSHAVGMTTLIVPALPEELCASRLGLLKAAQALNELARVLEPEGLFPGYHNHTWEFRPIEAELPWDTIFANAVPRVVMQLDIGNALMGGGDPLAALQRYAGRARTIHLKEYAAQDEKALLGEGEVEWEKVFALCESSGATQWYIVEQESGIYPPLECASRCLDNLRAMGKK